jgi:hypothetical protein
LAGLSLDGELNEEEPRAERLHYQPVQPPALDRAAERAAAYVQAQGDALARLRAAVLVGNARGSEAAARLAPDPGDAASLRAALEVCDDLRALGDARVREWCEALARLQHADGGFAPGLPLDARLYETGMIAGHLAKTRYARPDAIAAAADFLARHWTPDRVQGGSWRAIAAHAHCFANVDHDDADAVLQWCGRELGRAFAARAFDAVRTARVLVYCDAHGIPGALFTASDLAVALVTEQAGDGSYPEWHGDGARDAVASTLDGLVALRRLA